MALLRVFKTRKAIFVIGRPAFKDGAWWLLCDTVIAERNTPLILVRIQNTPVLAGGRKKPLILLVVKKKGYISKTVVYYKRKRPLIRLVDSSNGHIKCLTLS